LSAIQKKRQGIYLVFARSAAALLLLAPNIPAIPPNNAFFKLPTTPSSFFGSSGSSGSGSRRYFKGMEGIKR